MKIYFKQIYFVKQKVCAADAARALGVITAASEPLEGISTTYDAYTNYATRVGVL